MALGEAGAWLAGIPCHRLGKDSAPERLRGLAWRADAEAVRDVTRAPRLATNKQLVRVIVVDLADYRAGMGGCAA